DSAQPPLPARELWAQKILGHVPRMRSAIRTEAVHKSVENRLCLHHCDASIGLFQRFAPHQGEHTWWRSWRPKLTDYTVAKGESTPMRPIVLSLTVASLTVISLTVVAVTWGASAALRAQPHRHQSTGAPHHAA